MNKSGPIIVIEDDLDDQAILGEIFRSFPYQNELKFFTNGIEALEYLDHSDITPFVIISDVHLSRMSGTELRNRLQTHEQLRLKCIPYLFFTTGAAPVEVLHAYSSSIQGFFIKPSDLSEIRRTLKCIMEYWRSCTEPNYN